MNLPNYQQFTITISRVSKREIVKSRAAPAILLNLHFSQHHPCFPLKLQAPAITIIRTLISTVDTLHRKTSNLQNNSGLR